MFGGPSINELLSDEEHKKCIEDGSSLASSVQPMRNPNFRGPFENQRLTSRLDSIDSDANR